MSGWNQVDLLRNINKNLERLNGDARVEGYKIAIAALRDLIDVHLKGSEDSLFEKLDAFAFVQIQRRLKTGVLKQLFCVVNVVEGGKDYFGRGHGVAACVRDAVEQVEKDGWLMVDGEWKKSNEK